MKNWIRRTAAATAITAGLLGVAAVNTPQAQAHAVCSKKSHPHTGFNYTQWWAYSPSHSHPVLVSGVWRQYVAFYVTTHYFLGNEHGWQDPKPYYSGITC